MIRYKRLGYLALNVTDLDRSAAFYRDTVGLQSVPDPDTSIRFLKCSDKHHDIVLFQGEPGLKRVGFELESEQQIPVLQSALADAGMDFLEIPAIDRAAMHTGPGLRAGSQAGWRMVPVRCSG
jgi:2,3-dihydroxy-p-cumate/2,3-dihydroxybenzoate 3,4-dioxygenase